METWPAEGARGSAPGSAPQVPGYALRELLGAGARGSVWRAVRLADGRPFAVKVVPAWGDDAARELGVLGRLRVEGVVRLHEALTLDRPTPSVALVLDLLEGGSLLSVLAARGHLSVGEAVTVLAPVARAVAGLHAAGVVHADLSPGNVLFELSGRPLLADLGVSRLVGEAPGDAFGTEGFVAPEVLAGQQPSPSSDVYAVGALAWFCVAGAPPGPLGARRRLEDLAPGLPSAFADAVHACLAPAPQERPSAAEAALAFFDAAPCEPLRLVVPEDQVALLTRRIRAAATPGTEATEAAGRRRRLGRASVLAVLLPALVAPWGLWWAASHEAPAGVTGPPVDRTVPPSAGAQTSAARPKSPGGAAGSPDAEARLPRAPAGSPVAGSESVAAGPAGLPAARPSPRPPRPAPRLQADAPRTDPRALLQSLADTRAAVLVSGDPGRLGELDLPGSPAWAADERLLGRLAASGQRYAGLAFAVRSASGRAVAPGRATLSARVDTLPYDVRETGAATSHHPAEAGAELVVRLRWAGQRWVVEQVQASAG